VASAASLVEQTNDVKSSQNSKNNENNDHVIDIDVIDADRAIVEN